MTRRDELTSVPVAFPGLSSDAVAGDAVQKNLGGFLRLFPVSDAVALATGWLAAWQLSFGGAYGLLSFQYAILAVSLMLWFARTGHYRARMPFWTETKRIVEAGGFAMLVNCFLQIMARQDFSYLCVVAAWVLSTAMMIVFRAGVRRGLERLKVWTVPSLVIGSGRAAEEIRSVLGREKNLGYAIVAQIEDLPLAFRQAGSSWAALCASYNVRHVVVALDGGDYAHASHVCAQLARERIHFSVVQATHNLPVVGMMPQSFLGQEVMLMACNYGLDSSLSRVLKRVFDIVISVSALVVLAPVMLALAFFIKRDGGPVLYGHKRIGLDGKVFHCLKLRSMVVDGPEVLNRYLAENAQAREEWARDHKLRDDPRVTKVGAFIRRVSLDELPQLINVLRGDMSIVGPRPIIVAETAKYDSDITFYYRVRPGITGLWQVSGRNDVSYAERVRMDSWYVRNWSLWNDIAIICKTFGAVLCRRGAY